MVSVFQTHYSTYAEKVRIPLFTVISLTNQLRKMLQSDTSRTDRERSERINKCEEVMEQLVEVYNHIRCEFKPKLEVHSVLMYAQYFGDESFDIRRLSDFIVDRLFEVDKAVWKFGSTELKATWPAVVLPKDSIATAGRAEKDPDGHTALAKTRIHEWVNYFRDTQAITVEELVAEE